MQAWLATHLGSLHPVLLALIATLFTWGVTALGAAMVYLRREFPQKFLNGMLGMAAGIMIAASYWSLLAPAIEMAQAHPVFGLPAWVPAAGGFLAGGLFLYGLDKVLPHLHPGLDLSKAEGVKTRWQRSVLLVLAITLHNIPEGMAVGVAFGSMAQALDAAERSHALMGGIALAIGIGIQNFPEGLAVSMPLRREGMSRNRAFLFGQASGFVEPLAGVVGAVLVTIAAPVLPWALAFAAGAMIFVVIEELIPESQTNGFSDFATLCTLAGFTVMMILDVALG